MIVNILSAVKRLIVVLLLFLFNRLLKPNHCINALFFFLNLVVYQSVWLVKTFLMIRYRKPTNIHNQNSKLEYCTTVIFVIEHISFGFIQRLVAEIRNFNFKFHSVSQSIASTTTREKNVET